MQGLEYYRRNCLIMLPVQVFGLSTNDLQIPKTVPVPVILVEYNHAYLPHISLILGSRPKLQARRMVTYLQAASRKQ
jgi:hypothetical protein